MRAANGSGYTPLVEGEVQRAEAANAGKPVSTPAHGGLARGSTIQTTDVVQFTAMHFFVSESEGKMAIDVIRIGSLEGTCSVSFRTVDSSAEAGKRYVASSGRLTFNPGEALQSTVIEILESNSFDTTLTFKMELFDPENCMIDACLGSAPVYILDDDLFPTDKLEKQIRDPDPEALLDVSVSLLREYFKFTFCCVPTIGWKTLLSLFLDQLQNGFYLCTIFLRVYLIDVVLNVTEETEEDLIVHGNRAMSAVAVALACTLPHGMFILIERCVVGSLDMGFAIRRHHRVNVFRKYLNYTEMDRLKMGVQDLTAMQSADIPHLVEDGYLGIVAMVKDVGKIVCVSIFILRKDPRNALPILIFPIAIALWMWCRSSLYLHLSESAAAGVSACQDLIAQAANGVDSICDYEQRHATVAIYEELLTSQRPLTLALAIFEFWNSMLVPGLTVMAVGIYMAFGSSMVLQGSASVGTFLATINVFKDLGDRFDGIYKGLNKAQSAIEPLLELTDTLNKTDALVKEKKVNRRRREFTKVRMEEKKKLIAQTAQPIHLDQQFWDSIPIKFSNVTFDHIPHIKGFHTEIKQGSVVAVFGRHGKGKTNLLKLITGHSQPSSGEVLFSPHQTCLNVGYVPEILSWLNLLENLRFGAAPDFGDALRVRRIFKQISALPDDQWLMQLLDKEISTTLAKREDEDGGAEDGVDAKHSWGLPWFTRLSHTERKLIHISRAFIFKPQMVVLHKPLDDVEREPAGRLLKVFAKYAHETHHDRKRRTVFISSGTRHLQHMIADIADCTWDLCGHGDKISFSQSQEAGAQRQFSEPILQGNSARSHDDDLAKETSRFRMDAEGEAEEQTLNISPSFGSRVMMWRDGNDGMERKRAFQRLLFAAASKHDL